MPGRSSGSSPASALLLAVAVAGLPAAVRLHLHGESDELLRFGSCTEEAGELNLYNRNIRSLTPGVFDGMAGLE